MREEYEQYMKKVTDGFAKLTSYEGCESLLVPEGDKISVSIYQYTEYLLSYDKDLRHLYRLESENDRIKDFQQKRQIIAEKFLSENILTYEQFRNNLPKKD